ncbi:MAG: DUF3489 domain-containing protein [Dinoroseobacter sp.]|nr:DUF3489 domain-containing protein [Dinoroseobacter sp.]
MPKFPASDRSGSAKKAATHPAQLRKLLTRKSGATIPQIQKAFGWQPHTAQAAIAAQRKAGCLIERTDSDQGSVYRIVNTGAGA